METPTTEEIIEEVKSIKDFMKGLDFKLGIDRPDKGYIFNKLNKILRMLRCPVRRVKLQMGKE